jgi:hypothetical protein
MIIGHYTDCPRCRDTLGMKLLQQDVFKVWKRCSSTANYSADYIASSYRDRDRIYNMLSMILNELLENAVKHSNRNRTGIDLRLMTYKDQIVVQVDNHVTGRQYRVFRALAADLAGCPDPAAAYQRKLETLGRGPQRFGIGLMTILSCYGITCGFKFQPAKRPDEHQVSVQAVIPLQGAAS